MPRDSVSSRAAAPTLDRLPPYSEEAERGVLGSILLDSSRVMDLCLAAQVLEESFHVPAHRTLYEAMQKMHTLGKVVDVVTVTDFLSTDNAFVQMGGSTFLDRLIDATPTAAHAEYYIGIVNQKFILRSIIDCARAAEQSCHESEEEAETILDRTEQSFMDITERQHGDLVLWTQAVKSTMQTVESIFKGDNKYAGGIPTGLTNLDKVAMGLRPAEMVVLAARPSMGKTSLAMNIAESVALGHNAAHECWPVGVFSLEMSQESLVMRMLCSHAEVRSDQLMGGFASQTAHKRLVNAASALGKAQLYVDDTGGLDVLELRARARRMKKKFNIGLIVIDYLQLLHSREYAKQGRQLETASISGHLKSMAKELKLPVLVLSQLSRAPEQRSEKTGKPKLSDLRDSGAIEQDADMVWMLRRPCKYASDDEAEDRTLAILDVCKQRNGRTGEIELNFEESYTRFRDRAVGVDAAREPMMSSGAGDGGGYEEPL